MYKYNHDCPFEAYITNLGKYNEGELVGEWVKFPTTQETLEEVFKRIGIGEFDEFGQPYEEWFITDYDIYVDGITAVNLSEYEDLEKLNHLSLLLESINYHYMSKELKIDVDGSDLDLRRLIEIVQGVKTQIT